MHLSIDWSLCAGSGACAEAAPRAFELVPLSDGFTVRAVLRAPAPDDLLLEAAMACPTIAIHLRDESGPVYPA